MSAVRDALVRLLDVCVRADSEDAGSAPDELEYRAAITEANAALEATRPLPPPQLSPEAKWPFPVKQKSQ